MGSEMTQLDSIEVECQLILRKLTIVSVGSVDALYRK